MPSLGADGIKTLGLLNDRLKKAALPNGIKLGLTSSQGLSIGALIGLLADREGIMLPLASWGAGTRRMAALEIASATQSDSSITVIDEIERGLEPYRLRQLLGILNSDFGQSFVTTHSSVAIQCSTSATLWYLDNGGQLGELPRSKVEMQQRRDPETFLAKLAVIAEGDTEAGFLNRLLELAFGANPLDSGVRVCVGQGNQQTLGLLEALNAAKLVFASIVDDEGKDKGRWAALKGVMGTRLLQWSAGCTEGVVIGAINDDKVVELLKDATGAFNGVRLRTLAVRLGIQDKSLPSIETALKAKGLTLKQLIIEAASGSTVGAPTDDEKEWKSHGKSWFKSLEGGRELADRMIGLDAWPPLSATVLPLLNAILTIVGRGQITNLPNV
jgi:putative ATP-dependent endonuclease of OLD family